MPTLHYQKLELKEEYLLWKNRLDKGGTFWHGRPKCYFKVKKLRAEMEKYGDYMEVMMTQPLGWGNDIFR